MKEAPASHRDDAEARAAALGLLDCLVGGRFDEAHRMFDAQMASALPEPQLAAIWRQLTEKLGAYVSVEIAAVDHKDDLARVTLTTTFERALAALLVVITKEARITGFFVRPHAVEVPWAAPPYADPSAFTEEAITVGEGELALPGTLSLPGGDTAAKRPAIVLVHGSGPNDRDETIGASKPFKDLAWGLASRGVAVLRYEKVTRAHGPAVVARWGDDITLARDTIDDALTAVRALRDHPRIDPNKIVYLGHSQGAYAAPRAGERDPRLAGLILLAGPTRPIEDAALRQMEYIATLGGANGDAAKGMLPALREAVARVKSPTLSETTPKQVLPLGVPAPFWLDVRGYAPAEVAARLAMPLLVLQGEADYQVDMDDFAGWQQALANRPGATLKSYPGLLHTFVDGGCTLGTPADYDRPGHVAAEVIADIAAWVTAL